MAYNEKLTARLREALADVPNVEEKKMFRGVTFMIDGKMCVSAGDDELMLRIDPAMHDEALQKGGVRTVMMKGREYKGWVYVHTDAFKTKKQLNDWMKMALDFNKRARPSKRKLK